MEGLNRTLYKQDSLDVIIKQVIIFFALCLFRVEVLLLPLDDNTDRLLTFYSEIGNKEFYYHVKSIKELSSLGIAFSVQFTLIFSPSLTRVCSCRSLMPRMGVG